MPRVQVRTNDNTRQVIVDERVDPCHLDGEAGVQLLERIAWGIADAERREHDMLEAALNETAAAEAAVADARHQQRRNRRIRAATPHTQVAG